MKRLPPPVGYAGEGQWVLRVGRVQGGVILALDDPREPIRSIYVHIPFCTRRCHYCDFPTFRYTLQREAAYLEALVAEWRLWREQVAFGPLETVFWGGGTPSRLSDAGLAHILECFRDHFELGAGVEWSVECNPESLTAEKATLLAQAGVNRLSIGAQSFDDTRLASLGRTHTADQIRQAVEHARHAGIENLNLDLICALPGETLDELERDLQQALALQPTHLSVYTLIVEEGTVLKRKVERGEWQPLSEDEEADQYLLVCERLSEAGFQQYEISNFAREGFACRHNLRYWENGSYVGTGLGASGSLPGRRTYNLMQLHPYLNRVANGCLPIDHEDRISWASEAEESIWLGLRTRAGVSAEAFQRRFGVSLQELFQRPIAEMSAVGLLQADTGGIRLTDRGRLLGNEVFAAFLGAATEPSVR